MPGTTAKSPLDEHEVGDRAGHLRARALRDRQPRLLQRRHVVDAVADHRRRSGRPRSARRPRALAVGRDAADGGRRQHRLAQRGRFGGARSPSSAGAVPGTPASRAIAPTVAGASPESIFSSTSCSTKKATVSAAFGPQPLGEHDEPERLDVGREGRLGPRRSSGAVGAAEGEHAAPVARPPRAPASSSAGSAAGEPLGRARARAARRRGRSRSSAAATRTAPAPHDAAGLDRRASPASAIACERRVARGALTA